MWFIDHTKELLLGLQANLYHHLHSAHHHHFGKIANLSAAHAKHNHTVLNMVVQEAAATVITASVLMWAVLIAIFVVTVLAVFGALAALFLLHLYAKYSCGEYTKKTKMDGKTVIVTGCTSGIGKETALDLAKRGAKVIMACRNMDAAQKIKEHIVELTKNEKVFVKKLDLNSFKSIREFAADIRKSEKKLDVLIHNAGYAQSFTKAKSEDGIETTMQTNHYGPFLLTHLLIDMLKKNSPSRIVVVASSLYRLASVDLDNPNPLNAWPARLYYASKEANILFTKELARRLAGTDVTVNCLHPGLIDTGIWRNVPRPFSWGLAVVNKLFFKTPEQGCQTTVMLAVDEQLAKVSGHYFSDCHESSVSSHASDPARAKKLWEISEKIVQLEDNDPRI